MATAAGAIIINHQCVSSSISSLKKRWKNAHNHKKTTAAAAAARGDRFRVNCVSTSHLASDPYRILRIHPDASEAQVKKAFRELALKYHPDVCKGSDCGVQFQEINEAYDMIMGQLSGETSVAAMEDEPLDETMRGMEDPDWEMWEEWMGWEGAGIRDYSSHINPYI